MKLSIFTTVKDPTRRGDALKPAIECYEDLADELIIINGGDKLIGTGREIRYRWPSEFNWPFFGEQFQRGYEACTGDWVIKADLDYIFHEHDHQRIRSVLEANSDKPALSFYKYQFILPDRYNIKSRLVIAVNKVKYDSRIRFDGGGDLCQVTLDGEYLDPSAITESKIPFYNYEKILKTKEQVANDQGRMERAWHRYFGYYQMGSDGTDQSAFDKWLQAQKGKFSKPSEHISLEAHPKYMKDIIKNLKPENFGYSGWGYLEVNDYAKNP